MLYTRLASPVAVCIAIRGRYTRLAWLANPNTNPTKGPYTLTSFPVPVAGASQLAPVNWRVCHATGTTRF